MRRNFFKRIHQIQTVPLSSNILANEATLHNLSKRSSNLLGQRNEAEFRGYWRFFVLLQQSNARESSTSCHVFLTRKRTQTFLTDLYS